MTVKELENEKEELKREIQNMKIGRSREMIETKRITESTLRMDMIEVEERRLEKEVLERPKENMEITIWIWWRKTIENMEIKERTWETFKREALKNFEGGESREEEPEKKGGNEEAMPCIMQIGGESTKEWMERVTRIARERGISTEKLKVAMCMGIASTKVRGKAVELKDTRKTLEELKEGILAYEKEIMGNKRRSWKKETEKQMVKCYKCGKEGHISRGCPE